MIFLYSCIFMSNIIKLLNYIYICIRSYALFKIIDLNSSVIFNKYMFYSQFDVIQNVILFFLINISFIVSLILFIYFLTLFYYCFVCRQFDVIHLIFLSFFNFCFFCRRSVIIYLILLYIKYCYLFYRRFDIIYLFPL